MGILNIFELVARVKLVELIRKLLLDMSQLVSLLLRCTNGKEEAWHLSLACNNGHSKERKQNR